ncbi:MAG: recombinase family protein [Candidatus Hydrogenedentes bacterium]|nr:recombinase family protein [Candidatus Hydrogenedentota bacterium]
MICKRRDKRKRAPEDLEPEQPEADPTEYLTKASTRHRRQPFDAVILYYRVSTGNQHRNNNYAWQERCLRRYCNDSRIGILDEVYEAVNGNGVTVDARPELAQAVDLAKAHSVPILAAATDRFLRPKGFNKYDQSAQPSVADFEALVAFAPVPLLTFVAPDSKWKDVKSLQKVESAGCKHRQKPMRRRKRKDMLTGVIRELARCGLSCREIADELVARELPKVSHKTIWEWLNEPT